MLRQTDPRLDKYIQKYGCYFMSLIYHSYKERTAQEVNDMWAKCLAKGYINGDMNGDGDLDDWNEAIIVDQNGVCSVIGLNAIYRNEHVPATEKIPEGYAAVGCYYNPATKFRHFVAIDQNKKVIYDPILNSNTVRNGHLESMRLYKRV